jgi:hypothetical protein
MDKINMCPSQRMLCRVQAEFSLHHQLEQIVICPELLLLVADFGCLTYDSITMVLDL